MSGGVISGNSAVRRNAIDIFLFIHIIHKGDIKWNSLQMVLKQIYLKIMIWP